MAFDKFAQRCYAQMSYLMKKDERAGANGDGKKAAKRPGPKPSKQRGGASKAAPEIQIQGWPKDGDSYAPWMSRALLGELASKPSAIESIPEGTRFALIHHLSRVIPRSA